MTTPLLDRLKRQIALTGPITVADYMATCLFDPDHGYYTGRNPFGADGDFVTAPEISQIFGELIAVWVLNAWKSGSRPDRFILAEIGPGRGTLMKDMVRTWQRIDPGFLASASICLIETSPRLAAVQRGALGSWATMAKWTETLDDLARMPLYLVGNELFDAIPARQYVKAKNVWLERMIALDGNGNLSFFAGPGILPAAMLPAEAGTQPDGAVYETAPAREALAAQIGDRIFADGGAALFLDYGHLEPGFGDTLQAVRAHHHADVLSDPGKADLTSHVDFFALRRSIGETGASAACLTQGEFLLRMGILERAGRLGAGADGEARRRIEQEVERLAGPQQMGNLFKAMAVFRAGEAPEPFDATAAQ